MYTMLEYKLYTELTEEACLARECKYQRTPSPSVPWCYFDSTSDSHKYKVDSQLSVNGADST